MQFLKSLTVYVLVFGSILSPSAFAQGSMPLNLEAEKILLSTSALRERINAELEKSEFVAHLNELGVTKSEVATRLAAMTDQELAQVQQGVSRQVGGEVIVISVATLLIILIIILLVR